MRVGHPDSKGFRRRFRRFRYRNHFARIPYWVHIQDVSPESTPILDQINAEHPHMDWKEYRSKPFANVCEADFEAKLKNAERRVLVDPGKILGE